MTIKNFFLRVFKFKKQVENFLFKFEWWDEINEKGTERSGTENDELLDRYSSSIISRL